MVYSALPAYLYRKPHLFTSHDVFTDKQFHGVKGIYKKIILGISFHLVDTIHSVSYGAQDKLLKYFPNLHKRQSKLVVILNGIEIDRFSIDEQENWYTHNDLDEQTFLIGFFGRFMTQKGFRYLIAAIEEILNNEHNHRKPVVLAFGWGGFIREEQAEIKSRGLEKQLSFFTFPKRSCTCNKRVRCSQLCHLYGRPVLFCQWRYLWRGFLLSALIVSACERF